MSWHKVTIKTPDMWFSKALRLSKDYTCERCGLVGGPTAEHNQTQNCHILGRRNQATRYSVTNCLCMCAVCHRKTGENIKDHEKWVIEKYGQARMDRIHLTARGVLKPTKINLKLISDHYRLEFHRMTKTGARDLQSWN